MHDETMPLEKFILSDEKQIFYSLVLFNLMAAFKDLLGTPHSIAAS